MSDLSKTSVDPNDAQEAIRRLFQLFLSRSPKDTELSHLGSLLARGTSLVEVLDVFIQSPEFKSRQVNPRVRLHVPPGHFYSPVVDPETVLNKIPKIRPKINVEFRDIEIDIDEMVSFWKDKLLEFVEKIPFPDEENKEFRFHYINNAFSYGDAITLTAFILAYRPSRIIEVGSGWSTACMLDTINREGLDTVLTCVEPYPSLVKSLMWPEDDARTTIIESKVQDVDLELFDSLEANDILFIDSTHVVKTGSDVVFELAEVLPRLKEGVLIHFHDIIYPFEYGYNWVVEQNRSWNEVYALRSFLAFNDSFEVLFFNDMFAQLKPDVLRRDSPNFSKNGGGSIWLRRKKAPKLPRSAS